VGNSGFIKRRTGEEQGENGQGGARASKKTGRRRHKRSGGGDGEECRGPAGSTAPCPAPPLPSAQPPARPHSVPRCRRRSSSCVKPAQASAPAMALPPSADGAVRHAGPEAAPPPPHRPHQANAADSPGRERGGPSGYHGDAVGLRVSMATRWRKMAA